MTSEYDTVVPIMCSECMVIVAYERSVDIKGALYECKCGTKLRIKDDLSTEPSP